MRLTQKKRKLVVDALCCFLSFGAAAAQTPSVFIEDLTWTEVRDAISAGKTSAIFYAGSTEQNGPHMVLGKHNFVARHVAGSIAKSLGNALVYPIMPFAPTGDAASSLPKAGVRGAGAAVPASDRVSVATPVRLTAKTRTAWAIFLSCCSP